MVGESGFPLTPLARRIFAIAAENGFEARIVGGAVRDWLAGWPVGEIDMAVNTPITAASASFAKDGLKVIETGLAHGTVTVLDRGDRVGDSAPETIEVTQTRIDAETDGRHATIAFSADWTEDAARRDFTINALSIGANGDLFDPFDGQADLAAGRLRFVGDAAARVREDALRMLRYCRFLAVFGWPDRDVAALAALRTNAALASNLSGERVAKELSRMLAAPSAAIAIRLMQDTGLDRAALGQPLSATNLVHLPMAAVFAGLQAKRWLAGLAIAMPLGTARLLAQRLRLSRADRRCLDALDRLSDAGMARALEAKGWQRAAWQLQRDKVAPMLIYVVARARAGMPPDPAHCLALRDWQAPSCPVGGDDLLAMGFDSGAALGRMLKAVESRWVASDFALTRQDLLSDARDYQPHE